MLQCYQIPAYHHPLPASFSYRYTYSNLAHLHPYFHPATSFTPHAHPSSPCSYRRVLYMHAAILPTPLTSSSYRYSVGSRVKHASLPGYKYSKNPLSTADYQKPKDSSILLTPLPFSITPKHFTIILKTFPLTIIGLLIVLNMSFLVIHYIAAELLL